MDLSRKNESVFMSPRRHFGDMWSNERYGYSFFDGNHGFIFCNNVHFTSRSLKLSLGPELGISAPAGSALQLTTHFPERTEVQPEDGTSFRAGSTGEIWLRPFETLLLEVQQAQRLRYGSAQAAIKLGSSRPAWICSGSSQSRCRGLDGIAVCGCCALRAKRYAPG